MRKRAAVKRDVLADPMYNSKLVTKLINTIMKDGKKGTAQRILYDAFDLIKEKEEKKEAASVKEEDAAPTDLTEEQKYNFSYFASGGRLYFEINRAFGEATATMLRAQGYTNLRVLKDISGNDRIVIAER